MEQALELLDQLPTALIYLALGLGAALENFVPIVPADTFIVAGGFVSGIGNVDPMGVFLMTWGLNVAGAMAVYGIGHRYGKAFFAEGPGRRLLSIDQLGRLESFYERWGVSSIFLARFLPGLRALVPVFAGVTRQRPVRVLPPLMIASAIWYGGLVRLGFLTGENLDAVLTRLATANRVFLVVSVLVSSAVVAIWLRGRRPKAAPDSTGAGQ